MCWFFLQTICRIRIGLLGQFGTEKYGWRLSIVQTFREYCRFFFYHSGPKLCPSPNSHNITCTLQHVLFIWQIWEVLHLFFCSSLQIISFLSCLVFSWKWYKYCQNQMNHFHWKLPAKYFLFVKIFIYQLNYSLSVPFSFYQEQGV